MSLEKAKIQVLEGPNKGTFPVQFNPTEYTRTTQSVLTRKSRIPEFYTVKLDDFTVPLLFDSYEAGTDVREKTKKIAVLTHPSVNRGAKSVPPTCAFMWKDFEYKGVITSAQENYTMFLPTGVPVRCKLTVTFQSVMTPKEILKAMGMPNCLKFWTVKMDERLDVIAQKATRDATQWRAIAKLNRISDPLKFPQPHHIGRKILIPDV